jgi:hypothetical protein
MSTFIPPLTALPKLGWIFEKARTSIPHLPPFQMKELRSIVKKTAGRKITIPMESLMKNCTSTRRLLRLRLRCMAPIVELCSPG